MSSQNLSISDDAQAQVRATIVTIERALEHRPTEGTEGGTERQLAELRVAFASLVEQLALGPEPELRQCPVCQKVGMRAATRCGYCWTKLRPWRPGDELTG